MGNSLRIDPFECSETDDLLRHAPLGPGGRENRSVQIHECSGCDRNENGTELRSPAGM